MVDYYRVLGVSRDATSEDIKAAFRRLALKFHPDRHANSSKSEQRSASDSFRQVKEAYEILGNDKQRDMYNRSGARYSSPGTASSTYSAAQAARDAYARSQQHKQDWYRSEQRHTASSSGYRSEGYRSDWSYRSSSYGGRYANGPRRDYYDHNMRWNWPPPAEGPKIMIRATLFGMAVVTLMCLDSVTGSAWKYKHVGNLNGRVFLQKSYEEMVERVQQEKRAQQKAREEKK